MNNKPVIFGGEPIVRDIPGELFAWPVITKEDEDAVLEVLRRGAMSGTDVTRQFTDEFKTWQGCKYAVGVNNGTAAILSAMWACGVGVGDEVICPSLTYWASALPAYQLGATVVFADIDPETLCIAPSDIEHRITERTKVIIPVHYLGHPAEMDTIMNIAKRRNIKIIEDVSHAQGAYYKGKKLGLWGDVGAMSLMSQKSFATGEMGIIVTDDKQVYERAVAFGHYERFDSSITDEWLSRYAGLPMGGVKNRAHQLSSAVGRVQLKYYDERIREIRAAIDYFWSRLDGRKGLRPHKINPDTGDMGGWYFPHGLYFPEELGGLSITTFAGAIGKENISCWTGGNTPLHKHPLFQTADIYGHGKPTRIANSPRDVREGDKSLPVTENISKHLCQIPYFKRLLKAEIDKYADAFIRVLDSYEDLLKIDKGNPDLLGNWYLARG